MFNRKYVFVSLTVLSLLSTAAFASETMTCKFFGGSGSSDKGAGSWVQHCTADGTFEVDHHGHAVILHDDDGNGTLTLKCRSSDGDSDQDDQPKVVFDGRMRADVDETSSVFEGIRHHDTELNDNENNDSCTPPRILVTASDEAVLHGGERLAAEINYTFDGMNYDIPGECRFR